MILKSLITPLKPFRLVSLIMTYALGAGLVQYVEDIRSWVTLFQGAAFLLLLVLSLDYLRALLTLSDERLWPADLTRKEAIRLSWIFGLIAATFLTVATTIFMGWMVGGILWQGLIFLLLAVVIVGAVTILSQTLELLQPYQILFESLLIVVIPPAVAYFIQSEDLHQLLTMVVIGLVPAYLAFQLLDQLKRFGRDQQYELRTIVTTIGWENAMVLHNALILLAYLLMALVAILGFPWFLLWPVFLTLPIGLLEIWLMERVRRGRKPLWRVMQLATASVFLIPIYLLGFAFWIR